MFKMKLDNEKKLFSIIIGGFFTSDEGKNFLDSYNSTIRSINPSSYTLFLDGSYLLTSKRNTLSILKECITLYKNSGFKTIISLAPSSKTAKVQLLKAIEEVGAEIKFIDNIEY